MATTDGTATSQDAEKRQEEDRDGSSIQKQPVDGPPIAKAHYFLALELEDAKRRMRPDRLERIEPRYIRVLDNLIDELKNRSDDWEDEWPK